MKKYLIAALVICSISSNRSFAEDISTSPVANVQNAVFQSSLTDLVPDEDGTRYSGYNDYSFDDNGRSYKEVDPDNMPFFKQMRLTVTNKLMSIGEDNGEDKNKVSPFTKMKFWDKKKQNSNLTDSDDGVLKSESELANTIQSETEPDFEIPEDTISLEGGVREQVTEKQMMLDAENISYNEEVGDIIATGRPVMVLPPQKTKIIADKMVYNETSNILKAIGNVVIIRDGMPTLGDYLEVDMNEETMVMDNVDAKTQTMDSIAKKAIQKDGLLILHEGNFHSDESQVYRLASRMIGPRFHNMIIDEDAKSLFFGDPSGNNLRFDIGALYIDARKNHDVIKAKDIKIYHKDKYLFSWPSLTAYTNKQRDYFEGNYPEFGSRRKLGMFIGPGFVFGGPAGSVIKVIPFLNYNHKFGFGGALKYHNTYNTTELGYGSASDIFFMRGYQRLDDNLFLQYSANSYMDEWFLGARMPKYMAEVYYDKKFLNKDFLAPGKDLQFRHRFGIGIMEDNDRNFYGERINSNGISTTRTRYMAELRQSLYNYTNEEQRIAFDFSVAMQGSAAVYGTGDTQFIARFGPRFHIQYKNWMQDVGYFIAGYSDNTPLPRYDMYRYGHQSVYLTEAFRINKYLSVGWSGNINLSDDAPNGKMFQENRFIVAFGPDDCKISLGYDFVRQTTYFGFNVAFDTKGTTINYKKMEIKNPERLGQKNKNEEERKLAFAPAQKAQEQEVANKKSSKMPFLGGNKQQDVKPAPVVLKYAQVIDIEDPDKETVE